jgi:hypothetical protein
MGNGFRWGFATKSGRTYDVESKEELNAADCRSGTRLQSGKPSLRPARRDSESFGINFGSGASYSP